MKTKLAIFAISLCAICVIGETTFTGNLIVRPAWTYTTSEGSSSTAETLARMFDWDHTTGTNANQMTSFFHEQVTLTNGLARTNNLASVTDAFGATIVFAEVRMFAIAASSTNAHPLTIGAASANVFSTWCGSATDTVTVRPGGIFLMVAPDLTGFAVSTNGNLKILNTGTNSVSYEIYVGGSQ